MANRTPPFPPYPAWSTARFWSFIRSALRQASSRYPVKYEMIKTGRRVYKGKDKRVKWEHYCKGCNNWVKQSEIEIDHIVEVGKLSSYDDLPGFVQRLFCGPEGLQKLCKICHKKRTKEQRDGTNYHGDGE